MPTASWPSDRFATCLCSVGSRSRNGKRPVGISAWALLCLLLYVCPALMAETTKPDEVPASIRDFGLRKSTSIITGYCICDLKALPRPFTVERRGLDILINQHLFSRGREWPPFSYAVEVDPGDPPPGSSPLDPVAPGQDPRSGYWSRKARFLLGHHKTDEATELMVEIIRKTRIFFQVEHDKRLGKILLTDKDGKKTRTSLHVAGPTLSEHVASSKQANEDKDAILKQADEEMNDIVRWLETGGLLSWVTGGGWDYALPPEAAERFDRAVGDLRTPEHIVFRIRQEKLFPHDDEEIADELKRLFANGSYFEVYRTSRQSIPPPSLTSATQASEKPAPPPSATPAIPTTPGQGNPSPITPAIPRWGWLLGLLIVVIATTLVVHLRKRTQ
jgi:hypothetical protein